MVAGGGTTAAPWTRCWHSHSMRTSQTWRCGARAGRTGGRRRGGGTRGEVVVGSEAQRLCVQREAGCRCSTCLPLFAARQCPGARGGR